MNKAQKRFYGAALSLSTVASVIAPVAVSAATTYEDAKAAVDAAVATPVFSLFNKAYEAVIGLENKDQQAVLLAELAPVWDKAATPYVKETLAKLESLAKDKNLKTYHEVMAEIEAKATAEEATNKAYLLGELTAWGSSGALFTKEEKAAIDAINAAWLDKTPAKMAAAKEAIAKVTNAGSVEWLNAQVAEIEATLATTITEVKVVGARKLEVKFNKSVDDTKAVLAVKKGSAAATIEKQTYSANKNSVVIELAGKLTAGEYTVEVTGVETNAITGKVTATDEKVSKIELLSDTANVVTASATNVIEKLQVAYKVLNQYGEDITKLTTLSATAGVAVGNVTTDIVASNGKLEISNINPLAAPRLNDKISISLIHTETATAYTGIVTVSNKIAANSLTVTGIYNEDNEVLSADEDPSDFKLIIDAKDQYGNSITNPAILADDLIVSVSNPTVTNVKYSAANKGAFEKLRINGEDKIVLSLDSVRATFGIPSLDYDIKAGTATLTLISKTTAASSNYDIKVADGVKVDSIKFSQPTEVVAAGETFKIPFEAVDTYGKPVTKASVLNNLFANDVRGVRVTASGVSSSSAPTFKQDYATGKAYLEVTALDVEGIVNVTAVTATHKTDTMNISIKKKAVPTAIAGFDADVPTDALINEAYSLKLENFKVQDQYGRIMTDAKFRASIGNSVDNYRVVVEKAETSPVFSHNGVTTGLKANEFAFKFDGTDTEKKDASVTLKASGTKGSEQFAFRLQKYAADGWKNVSGSEYQVTSRAVALTDLKAFEVGKVAKMFDEVGYATSAGITLTYNTDSDKYASTFKVYGKLSDSKKVIMPATPSNEAKAAGVISYYTTTTNDVTVLTPSVPATAGESTTLNVTSAAVYAKDTEDKTYQVKVTINHTGDVVVNDTIVSKAKPTVAGIEFNNDLTSVDGTVTDGIDAGSVQVFKYSGTGTHTLTASNILGTTHTDGKGLVFVKDQYGKTTYVDASGIVTFATGSEAVTTRVTSVTFSEVVESNQNKSTKLVNNGETNATITGLEEDDSFTATFTFANGKSASLKIVIGKN